MAESGRCSHRLVEVHLHENNLILPTIMKDYSVFRINGGEWPLLSYADEGLLAWLLCVQDQWGRAAAAPIDWWRSTCMRTI
jgi:hypothetical protein